MNKLILKDEAFAIVGAAIEVHAELGPGFLEAVYQEALEVELGARGIPSMAQVQLPIHYKGRLLKQRYVADFVCYDAIIVELKAAKSLTSADESQVLNYLKATGYRLGLLFNFGSYGKLQWTRLVH